MKILGSQKVAQNMDFESFAGSKVICVENKYIPCLCTRFRKSLRTLTTNQLRKNTHPTNVVASLKRFVRTVHPR